MRQHVLEPCDMKQSRYEQPLAERSIAQAAPGIARTCAGAGRISCLPRVGGGRPVDHAQRPGDAGEQDRQ